MDKKINLLSPIVISSQTLSQLVPTLVHNRSITDFDEFINPPYPKLKLTLKPAINLINKIIKSRKNILIYGDYDVDGITATAVLWQAIYKNYPNVTPFVPHRQRDGYGIKAASFFRFQQEKNIQFDLLITVDNGIVADKELAKIKSKQPIKIIVTDHHLGNVKLESADCIVHNVLISGAGVSWFLAKELDPSADLGLAALGSVADCLPLTGVNRSLVVHGLAQINSTPSLGLQKLIQISGIHHPVSVYELGFLIGPRINAIGRLSDPTDALRLLCSQNNLQASRYAKSLNDFNQDRQVIQKDSLEQVELSISKGESRARPNQKIIFVSGPYNAGIIGLIAGRLTGKYYLPSIVISVDGDIAKGSCRSIPELNIIESLRHHSDLFIDLGGHSGAAGFSILTKNINKLEKSILKTVNSKLNKLNLMPHLDVDLQMDLSVVNTKTIKSIQQLAPFGIGNPEPLFLFKDLNIQNIRTIGQTNDHLKLKLNNIDAIAFKKGELVHKLKVGDSLDVIASLSINEWNNVSSPQLIIKEIII
ncbi:MAG: single-stranded-DNA-specific exonuclease RecJ [Microgenomates group bacterium]